MAIVRIRMLRSHIERHPRRGDIAYTKDALYLVDEERAAPMIAEGAAEVESIPEQRGLDEKARAGLRDRLEALAPQPPAGDESPFAEAAEELSEDAEA